MKHQRYPTKTEEFGANVYISRIEVKYAKCDLLEMYKKKLIQQFEDLKEKLERDGDKIFCTMHDPEWVSKPISSNSLNKGMTLGWMCKATGRAFYMDRLGRCGKIYERHPYKKCVPKRKRGKINFKRFRLGEIIPSSPSMCR